MTNGSVRRRATHVLASVNGDGRHGLALLALVAIVLLSGFAGRAGIDLLAYQRDAIGAGELWRLLSGHWVHFDPHHALLNALGLALLWMLFARDLRPAHWLLVIGASIAAIDAGLWWLDPDVGWYVGASGWLHGVLAAGAWVHLRRGDADRWLLVALLIAKLLMEQRAALPFSGDMPVIVEAHLYGAVGGLAAAICLPPRREPL